LTAIKNNQGQLPTEKNEEVRELTPEEKTELINYNPNEFERLLTEKVKREILGEIEKRQKTDQEQLEAASRQRGIELYVRMGEQHFNTKYPEMKIYEPFVKEESEKLITSPSARELISQGPQAVIDKAVENTKIRIEQIRMALSSNSTTQPQPAISANTGEIRTPIPASPVVKPTGVIPAPTASEVKIPTQEEINKDYVEERNAWRAQRGLS